MLICACLHLQTFEAVILHPAVMGKHEGSPPPPLNMSVYSVHNAHSSEIRQALFLFCNVFPIYSSYDNEQYCT